MGLLERLRSFRAPINREVVLSFPGIPPEIQSDPDVLLAQSVLSRITTVIAGELQPSQSIRPPYPLYRIDVADYDTRQREEVDVVFDPTRHRMEQLTELGPALWERMTDPRKVGEIRPYLRAVARRLRVG